ncbi:hypothetical protein [Sporolactobacillus nakayamae]|uniref:Uncharacterized protein n=1 Tax=Sporolactobacillus nakayamae TaxID=269670 RepID=A0A1I2P481_9BACL|nr:hypothetical protein [Sporolactobacillus nakayamae]SFG10333.1 hypothetical protein SAMN02982927_00683 [Sporolactobacillus nakayamae]
MGFYKRGYIAKSELPDEALNMYLGAMQRSSQSELAELLAYLDRLIRMHEQGITLASTNNSVLERIKVMCNAIEEVINHDSSES